MRFGITTFLTDRSIGPAEFARELDAGLPVQLLHALRSQVRHLKRQRAEVGQAALAYLR